MGLKFRFINGIVFGTGGVAIKALLNILLIPIILSHLGADNYGFYTLLITFSDILVMLDLGLTTGIIHRLSRAIAENSRTHINETLGVGQRLYSLFLLLILGIAIPAIPWIQQSFHLSPALQPIGQLCLYMVLADAAINFAGYFLRAILMAHSLYQWTNTADVIQGLASTSLSCLLLLAGFGLIEVLMVRLLATMLQNGFLLYQVYKVEPDALRLQFNFSWIAFKDMFIVSVSAMIGKVCMILGYRLDNIIIAANLTLMDVTVYSLVARIFGQVPYLTSKLSEGLLPVYLKMETLNRKHDSGFLFLRISALINYVTLTLLLLLCLHYRTIFDLLSRGKINYDATIPLIWVTVPILWSSTLVCPAYDYLFAKRHFKLQNILSLGASAINVGLSVTLVKIMGGVGALLGSAIPHCIEHQVILIPRTCREMNISLPHYYQTVHLKNLLPLLSIGVTVEAGRLLFGIASSDYASLIALTGFAVSIGSIVWLQHTASPMERELFRDRVLPGLARIGSLLRLPVMSSRKTTDAS